MIDPDVLESEIMIIINKKYDLFKEIERMWLDEKMNSIETYRQISSISESIFTLAQLATVFNLTNIYKYINTFIDETILLLDDLDKDIKIMYIKRK